MSETYYPAVFHKAEDIGGYWVEYPDLPGCLSLGGVLVVVVFSTFL